MSGSSEQKTDQASNQKLKKQRDKGVIQQASEAASYISQVFALIFFAISASWILEVIQLTFDNNFQTIGEPMQQTLTDAFWDSLNIYKYFALPVIFLTMSTAVLIAIIVQKGVLFSIDPVLPKFEKIDPIAGLKRIFGLRGFLEFCFSILRITIFAIAVSFVLYFQLGNLIFSFLCGINCIVDVALAIVLSLVLISMILFCIFAIWDILVQKFIFGHEQMMTKSEVKRERKDQHGSTETRKERRRFQSELKQAAESGGLSDATMAVFFDGSAIALRYHPENFPNPTMVAKARLRKEAKVLCETVLENGFGMAECRGLVRGMISRPVGSAVTPELYGLLVESMREIYGN